MTPGRHFVRLTSGGRERRYLAHVPPNPAPPLPAVVMLHGTGGTPTWTLDETRWAETAERDGFLVALPEGLPADPDQPAHFLRNPPLWRASPRSTDAGHVAFLRSVLDDLVARFGVDPARVGLTGFSNGASMAFRAAAEFPERLAAVAPVAGFGRLDDLHPSRPVPTLFLVGTEDPLLPLAGGEVTTPWGKSFTQPPVAESLRKWAAKIGCATGPQVEHVSESVRVERYPPHLTAWFVSGLGHQWPGGLGRLQPRWAGTPSDRVRANDV